MVMAMVIVTVSVIVNSTVNIPTMHASTDRNAKEQCSSCCYKFRPGPPELRPSVT